MPTLEGATAKQYISSDECVNEHSKAAFTPSDLGVSFAGASTTFRITMQDDDFEWDDAKAVLNWSRHGVRFETAREVFRDVFAIEWDDVRHDHPERRFVALGMVDGRLLYVAYTLRDDCIRIISARYAEPQEQRKYYNDNSI